MQGKMRNQLYTCMPHHAPNVPSMFFHDLAPNKLLQETGSTTPPHLRSSEQKQSNSKQPTIKPVPAPCADSNCSAAQALRCCQWHLKQSCVARDLGCRRVASKCVFSVEKGIGTSDQSPPTMRSFDIFSWISKKGGGCYFKEVFTSFFTPKINQPQSTTF